MPSMRCPRASTSARIVVSMPDMRFVVDVINRGGDVKMIVIHGRFFSFHGRDTDGTRTGHGLNTD